MRDDKNSIRKAIEMIEPDNAAKERMFANIKRKATEQTAGQQKSEKILRFNAVMKWALPVAACLVLVVAGVLAMPYLLRGGAKFAANYDAADPMEPMALADSAQIANPWSETENAYSLAEGTGIEIDAPENAEKAEYRALGDEIAEVTFVVDGHEYSLRASGRGDDFSGLYGTIAKESSIASANGNAELTELQSGEEIYLKIEWSNGETNYVMTNTDGASKEEFLTVYESVKANPTLD